MSDQPPPQPNTGRKESVSKKLTFGATTSQPSASPNRMDLSQMTEEEQRQKEKWNYDFKNDTPLEGNWEWKRVAPPQVEPTQSENKTEEV